MELKVGMYVRTHLGIIYKLKYDLEISEIGDKKHIHKNESFEYIGCVVDASFDVTDLITMGDLVDKIYVWKIDGNKIISDVKVNGELLTREIKDIKTILTHEQYEANCFKIGE